MPLSDNDSVMDVRDLPRRRAMSSWVQPHRDASAVGSPAGSLRVSAQGSGVTSPNLGTRDLPSPTAQSERSRLEDFLVLFLVGCPETLRFGRVTLSALNTALDRERAEVALGEVPEPGWPADPEA